MKGFQGLNFSLEANCSWLDAVLGSSLRHDRTDQIGGQDVRPDFLADQFWRFAAQHVHLQRAFECSQVEFCIPTRPVELSKIVLGKRVDVEQCCGDDEALNT